MGVVDEVSAGRVDWGCIERPLVSTCGVRVGLNVRPLYVLPVHLDSIIQIRVENTRKMKLAGRVQTSPSLPCRGRPPLFSSYSPSPPSTCSPSLLRFQWLGQHYVCALEANYIVSMSPHEYNCGHENGAYNGLPRIRLSPPVRWYCTTVNCRFINGSNWLQ